MLPWTVPLFCKGLPKFFKFLCVGFLHTNSQRSHPRRPSSFLLVSSNYINVCIYSYFQCLPISSSLHRPKDVFCWTQASPKRADLSCLFNRYQKKRRLPIWLYCFSCQGVLKVNSLILIIRPLMSKITDVQKCFYFWTSVISLKYEICCL